MGQWKPQDYIALVIILGVIVLVYNRIDGPLTDMAGIVVGFYFGHKVGTGDTSFPTKEV